MTIITRFMLTYLTMGPANLTLNQFAQIQTLFWVFFILGKKIKGIKSRCQRKSGVYADRPENIFFGFFILIGG